MSGIWKDLKQLSSQDGMLCIDSCTAEELLAEYGSPLYVYSQRRIEENYRRLLETYRKYYSRFNLYYAVKANNNPSVVKVLVDAGAGLDCSCIGEIEIAKLLGVSSDRLIFTGAYPSEEVIRDALDFGVALNLDNWSCLDWMSDRVPEILSFRVNPGQGSGGEEQLIFSGPDAKFGVAAEELELAYARAKEMGVQRFGVHMMTGSNVLEKDYFAEMVSVLMDLIGPISQRLGIQFEWVDIGGSLGVPYRPEQNLLDLDHVAKSVVSVFRKKLSEYKMGEPILMHEPGRYLLADAGVLLATVTNIKEGERCFVGVDAGMNTLLRPAFYGSYHHVLYSSNLDAACTKPVNLVGPICENGDQFHHNYPLPKEISVGDQLAFLNAGAYGFVMSSQYNTQPRAAEVLVCDGQSKLIRQRENFEDLIRGTHYQQNAYQEQS
ncbi:MAG: diaminopimelate decarboxylase [Waddliaceae bacterium]|nr:diaminopimelate decarboxylase [Waddliaceae bacterium]